MGDILSTGSSALLAFQKALSVTSHNVANAATPGYSRQRLDLKAIPGSGQMNVGGGVTAARLQRLADSMVFSRELDGQGELGRLQQVSDLATRVDKLVSDPATGIATQWSGFFAAAQDLTSDPAATVARSQLISAGEQLTARFNSLHRQLGAIEADADTRLETKIAEANTLAVKIADLNRKIASAGSNAVPELLDQRANHLRDLSGLVGGTTVEQPNGAINLFLPGGQALVLDSAAMQLSATPDPYRANRMSIGLQVPGGAVSIRAEDVSGEIGGVMEFREQVLDPARAELGLMATAFAESFNATQRAGVDYNGDPGGDFFRLPPPVAAGHPSNTGGATLNATIADVGALTGHDLLLVHDGGSWTATRADTREAVALTGTGTAADPLLVDGVALVLDGTPGDGDRFMLTPTANAAGGLQQLLNDPAKVAAAAPMTPSLGAGNSGSVGAVWPQVTDPATFAGFSGAEIEFLDGTSYSIDGGPAIAWAPGDPVRGDGWSMTLDGTPAAGDRFTLSPTPAQSSDNTNALALADLDGKGILAGGTVDVTSALAQFTARTGSAAQLAQMNLDAQQSIQNQTIAEREAVSGVNLDEEVIDIMRFHQAYQAAAQVLTTSNQVFQSLMSAISR